MTKDRRKRAAEWFLTLKEIPIGRIHEFIAQHATTQPTNVPQANEPND